MATEGCQRLRAAAAPTFSQIGVEGVSHFVLSHDRQADCESLAGSEPFPRFWFWFCSTTGRGTLGRLRCGLVISLDRADTGGKLPSTPCARTRVCNPAPPSVRMGACGSPVAARLPVDLEGSMQRCYSRATVWRLINKNEEWPKGS